LVIDVSLNLSRESKDPVSVSHLCPWIALISPQKLVYYKQSPHSWFVIIDTRTNKMVAIDAHTQIPGGAYFA
jgi:hypothetical protein